MAIEVTPLHPDRAHVDLSDETVLRHWMKKTGKTREEIAAAIKKVGNNAETLARELKCSPELDCSTD